MTHVPVALRRLVLSRANGRCEYCLVPDDMVFYPHEIDHIRAEKHQGETSADNLCLSCWFCNRHKGSDLSSIDPLTDLLTPLFNPRTNSWEDHFRLNHAEIIGITAIGRTTVRMLHFNDPDQIEYREVLITRGLYP